MTREPAEPPLPPEEDADDGVRGLLRGMRDDEGPPADVLPGVQQKLRERSGGKFYADLWSTARQPPTATFLVTAALMLAVALAVYAVMAPLRGRVTVVPTEPAPIGVVAPAPR